MKILLAGANGQLGRQISRMLISGQSTLGLLPKRLERTAFVSVDLPETDLSDLHTARQIVSRSGATAVINCAAFTNVDKCETHFDDAFKANAVLARNLAIACSEADVKLLHVSTDYVFSGNASAPVSECELPAPCSAYGKTKLLGEEYVKQFCKKSFIVRTAWLYGEHGGNFVKTIAAAARRRGGVEVVNDQLGNPTNAEDLAYHILKLIVSEEYGVYHITGKGICSWFEFTQKIIEYAGIEAEVLPVSTARYLELNPSAAKRPAYSALDHTMLRATVGDEMRPWQEALKEFTTFVKL